MLTNGNLVLKRFKETNLSTVSTSLFQTKQVWTKSVVEPEDTA